MELVLDKLCWGLPWEFAEYLGYCQSLAYEVEPNYDWLLGLLRNLMKRSGYQYTDYDRNLVARWNPSKKTSWDILFKWTLPEENGQMESCGSSQRSCSWFGSDFATGGFGNRPFCFPYLICASHTIFLILGAISSERYADFLDLLLVLVSLLVSINLIYQCINVHVIF